MTTNEPLVSEFLVAACAPRDSGHATGTLERANALLEAHPEIASASIHTAAVLGDDVGVRRFLALDPASATVKGGPHGWDALTHLCFSRYLRLDRARSDTFVRAATALLDAGADPNTGWHEAEHEPSPSWESAIYGVAGVAQHPELTRLLLQRGADPNDGETPYHVPESHDNATLRVLLESGKLTADSLSTLLLRKADWHDAEGMQLLLEHGADPDRVTVWGITALQQALRRDNDIENIALLLEHGADPTLSTAHGMSAISIAAHRGRGDVLELFARRGFDIALGGVGQLISAAARDDITGICGIAKQQPQLVRDVVAVGGTLLAQFAGVGNVLGVRHLLNLGVPVDAPYVEGDGYFGIPANSMAIHVAAWRARHATLKLLLDRGSPVDVPDSRGRTPLALAIRACVDSYWTSRRSPESVEALLRAGASAKGIPYPTGYDEVDALLRER